MIVTENHLDKISKYILEGYVLHTSEKEKIIEIPSTNQILEIGGVAVYEVVDSKRVEHSGVANTFEYHLIRPV